MRTGCRAFFRPDLHGVPFAAAVSRLAISALFDRHCARLQAINVGLMVYVNEQTSKKHLEHSWCVFAARFETACL